MEIAGWVGAVIHSCIHALRRLGITAFSRVVRLSASPQNHLRRWRPQAGGQSISLLLQFSRQSAVSSQQSVSSQWSASPSSRSLGEETNNGGMLHTSRFFPFLSLFLLFD